MTKSKLKLVKTNNQRLNLEAESSSPRVQPSDARSDEAARFEALRAARIARQVMLHRIMAEFEDLDEASPAA